VILMSPGLILLTYSMAQQPLKSFGP